MTDCYNGTMNKFDYFMCYRE